jgi:hypothetical protein
MGIWRELWWGLGARFLLISALPNTEFHFNLNNPVIQIHKLAGEIVHGSLNPGEASAKIAAQIVNAGADSLEAPVV